MPEDEYAIRLLGAFCKRATDSKSKNAKFLEYIQIKDRLSSIVTKDWGLKLSEAEHLGMMERTRVYSKDPEKDREFKSDSEVKRTLATERQRELATEYIESQRAKLMNEATAEATSWSREWRPKLI